MSSPYIYMVLNVCLPLHTPSPHPPPLPPHPCVCPPYLILSDWTSLHNLTFYASLFKYLSQRQLCDNLCSRSGYHSGESHDGLMLCCHCLEWNLAIYSNMDGHREYHTKWSKPEKDKRRYDITYMWNLKKSWFKWTYIQNRNGLIDIVNKCGYQKAKGGRDKLGIWN